MKKPRLRFSLRALLATVLILAVCLGGWVGYSRYKIQKLTQLRQEGVIVILRDRTPKLLQSIGIKNLSPFFDVPTVELYVTPKGSEAIVGNSETAVSVAAAQQQILQQAAVARSYGASDIHLIQVDDRSPEWSQFAQANSFVGIGERSERYRKRLAANQESGANINP